MKRLPMIVVLLVETCVSTAFAEYRSDLSDKFVNGQNKTIQTFLSLGTKAGYYDIYSISLSCGVRTARHKTWLELGYSCLNDVVHSEKYLRHTSLLPSGYEETSIWSEKRDQNWLAISLNYGIDLLGFTSQAHLYPYIGIGGCQMWILYEEVEYYVNTATSVATEEKIRHGIYSKPFFLPIRSGIFFEMTLTGDITLHFSLGFTGFYTRTTAEPFKTVDPWYFHCGTGITYAWS